MISARTIHLGLSRLSSMTKVDTFATYGARLASARRHLTRGFAGANAPYPLFRLGVFPPPMHPVPLFRVPNDQAFQGRIISPRIETDRFIRILRLDRRNRLAEAQHVSAVRLAPAR